MASRRHGHCWVRIHDPKGSEQIGRCEVIEREPLFAFRSALPHKPKHRKAWWKR